MFDTEIAKAYGVEEAIVIANLVFWLETNKANNVNFHDGRYWTYNTLNAFVRLFPFWTAKQIRRIFDSLERQNVIIKGNHNETTYDRTLWYALTDEFIEKWSQTKAFVTDIEPFAQMGKCKCPNGKMDLPKRENGFAQMGTTIPYNKQNNKPNESLEGGADAPALAPTKNEGTAQEGESLPPKPQNPEGEPTEATAEVNQSSPSPKFRRTPSPREFVPPTIEEVEAYCQESGYIINAGAFVSYFESVKWIRNGAKIKDWKAAVRQWWYKDHPNEKPMPAKAKTKTSRPAWERLGMTEEQWLQMQ